LGGVVSQTSDAPGPLIARGRSADVYDIGGGRVLRRQRAGVVAPDEVAAMRVASQHGVPVPAVHAVDGADLVLDRVAGDDMLTILGRRPWHALRFARILAELHVAMRAVPAPEGMRSIEPAEALVHGDLHPGNVLMSAAGPIVIDWEGAVAGPADADVATTWLLMTAAVPDDVPLPIRPLVGMIRAAMRRTFLRGVPPPRAATIDLVCELRLVDPNMRDAERERIREFGRRYGTGGTSRDRP
jgi:aminoglycoside phosphotransferase (APT) family kinase protein